MAISVAAPDDDTDDSLFVDEDEAEGTEYNMRELMDQVYAKRDVIFTLPTEQVPILKSGLIVRKGKDSAKLKDADISQNKEYLSFLVTPSKTEGVSDVRVKLGPKKSVRILDMRVPNDEF